MTPLGVRVEIDGHGQELVDEIGEVKWLSRIIRLASYECDSKLN